MPSDNSSVLIVAGEASSSAYAVQLLKHWKSEKLGIKAFGVGSAEMVEQGFEALGASEDIAVVGISEVLKSLSRIQLAFRSLLTAAKQRRPSCAILMDMPDFNLRLAKKLKALGIPVVYYISPQVWAWRQGRVKTIRKYVDKMLVLLPFEEPFYRERSVDATFVGHPLLDEIKPELFQEVWCESERSRYGIEKGQVVLGLMPGSRRGEIDHLLDLEIEVARRLKGEFSSLAVILMVAPTLDIEALRKRINSSVPLVLIKRDPFEMIAMADVVLAASGTATLMVALLKKPMVIVYRLTAVTAWIGRRLIKTPKFVGLPNILLDEAVAPEFIQEDATVENLVSTLRPLIASKDERNKIAVRMARLHGLLGERGAYLRVTEVIKGFLK